MLSIGDIVLVEVTGIEKYGFFIKYEDFTGLCHISEISNDYVENINDYVLVGNSIYVLIKDIDMDNKKLSVSIKDINYKNCLDSEAIEETRRGFLPLKEMLPVWIEEYKKRNIK